MSLATLLQRMRLPATVRAWHSVFGMVFAVILLFLFVTGSAALFGREIDWLVNPAQRVVPLETGKRSFGDTFDAVRATGPDWAILSIQRMAGARFADQVTVGLPDGGGRRLVLVDPYRDVVQGVGSTDTVWFVLRELHRGLSSNSQRVRLLVAGMALPLAVLLVTSLLLYRTFYRGLFRLPRRGARRRAVLGDLHRLVGAWSLIFMVPLVLTSTVFALEYLGVSAMDYPDYEEDVAYDGRLPPGFGGAALDRAVAVARRVHPGLDVTDIELPRQARLPIVVRGRMSAVLERPAANTVFLDPASLTVRGAQRGEAAPVGRRLGEAARIVHFGSFGGLPTRILWLIFGIAVSLLAALGALIYAERLVFMSERDGTVPPRSRLGHVRAGMGAGGWAGLAVVVLAAGLTLRRLL